MARYLTCDNDCGQKTPEGYAAREWFTMSVYQGRYEPGRVKFLNFCSWNCLQAFVEGNDVEKVLYR